MESSFNHEEGKTTPNFERGEFWDERYKKSPDYVYGKAPNAFFKQTIDQLEPGRLLLPAEGEGRNAVYAASRGWQVDAFDFSTVALQKARKLAEAQAVEIHYSIADATSFTTNESYHLIAFIFLHMNPKVRKHAFRRYLSFLKPGGRIVMEVYNKKQLGKPSGGPKVLEYLINKEEVADIFQELDIEYLAEVSAELNEGPYHRGIADTTRMVATKN